ncbi:polyprenyl synthetase family protein [Embleya sp. NPDC050493]|uniref:polyprenyl synthetase family protein n=1 Tax=Embleya sp. NPDC050493 TaxID=3363989 RepID=UPI0037B84C94
MHRTFTDKRASAESRAHWVEIPHPLTAQLARVDSELQDATEGPNAPRPELTAHLTRAGGKKLRPLLVLASAHAVSAEIPDGAIKAATAVELLHLATLYHDDVMDSAATRRDRPTANSLWGNNRSIMAGDMLLAQAYLVASSLAVEDLDRISRTLEELCSGQVQEMETAFDPRRTIEQYRTSIEGKTACLLATACWLGARQGGATPAQAEALARYGLELGIAFQIIDDILDLYGNPASLGKPVGGDLRAGVYTLPLILAIQQSPSLSRLLSVSPSETNVQETISDPAVVAAAARAASVALRHMELALEHLAACGGRADGTDLLTHIADAVSVQLRTTSLPRRPHSAAAETLHSLRQGA